MSRHCELTEDQSALIENRLPARGRRGGQWKDHRAVLNGVFRILHAVAQWRELRERYGTRSTVRDQLTRWRADGTLDRILERLHLKPDGRGRIDTDFWPVDATIVRAGRAATGGQGGKAAGEPDDQPWDAPAAAAVAPGHAQVGASGAGLRSGAAKAAGPGPAPHPAESLGRRQGLQLSPGPSLPPPPRPPGCGPACGICAG